MSSGIHLGNTTFIQDLPLPSPDITFTLLMTMGVPSILVLLGVFGCCLCSCCNRRTRNERFANLTVEFAQYGSTQVPHMVVASPYVFVPTLTKIVLCLYPLVEVMLFGNSIALLAWGVPVKGFPTLGCADSDCGYTWCWSRKDVSCVLPCLQALGYEADENYPGDVSPGNLPNLMLATCISGAVMAAALWPFRFLLSIPCVFLCGMLGDNDPFPRRFVFGWNETLYATFLGFVGFVSMVLNIATLSLWPNLGPCDAKPVTISATGLDVISSLKRGYNAFHGVAIAQLVLYVTLLTLRMNIQRNRKSLKEDLSKGKSTFYVQFWASVSGATENGSLS